MVVTHQKSTETPMPTSLVNFKMLPLLTPAEVLVLLHGKNANFKELIKMTLMDLLLRKVLAVKLYYD
jgi:hypothetical protein